MKSKELSKLGSEVFVFSAILVYVIIKLFIAFDYINLMYLMIILFYFIKYFKLKIS